MLTTTATALLLVAGAQALVPRACTYTATADAGSTCASIASDWGITVEQFKSFNPSITDCSKLTSGATYCVEWEGALPGASSTKTTFTTSTTTTSATKTSSTLSGPSPTQTGIISTCNKWHKVAENEFCETVVRKNNISLEQFYQWNPAVGNDCRLLFLGYYVCVGVSGGSGTTPKPSSTTTTAKPSSTSTAPPPIQTQPGVVANCKKFHQVAPGDGCWAVETKYSISHSDFKKWNPMLDDGCSNMWLGYYVCVGV